MDSTVISSNGKLKSFNLSCLIMLHIRITGRKIHALNLSSYNYLGFSETEGTCADEAHRALCTYGAGVCSTRRELGK